MPMFATTVGEPKRIRIVKPEKLPIPDRPEPQREEPREIPQEEPVLVPEQ